MPSPSSRSSSPTRSYGSSPRSFGSPYSAPNPTMSTNPTAQGRVWQSVKEGFGWGIGTSIARNLFGPSSAPTPVHTTTTSLTSAHKSVSNVEYEKCLEEAHGDEKACEHLRT